MVFVDVKGGFFNSISIIWKYINFYNVFNFILYFEFKFIYLNIINNIDIIKIR